MKDLIIINAFPNNTYKCSLLEKQLFYFKKLGIKIMAISGCDVPEKLRKQIDYLIINKDNITIDKDHAHKTFFDLGLKDTAFLYFDFHTSAYGLFESHVNITIVKNIKIAFNVAKTLGYENVFYTEDDNIFKDESLSLIKDKLKLLNDDKFKLIGVHDFFADSDVIYTTFFFSKTDFLLDKFIIPDEKSEYYKDENILKYKLQKPLEVSFYEILKDDLSNIKDIKDEFQILKEAGHIEFGLNCRTKTKEWAINTFASVVADVDKKVYIIVHNVSYVLNKEQQQQFTRLEADIYFDDVFIKHESLNMFVGFFRDVPPHVKTIKVKIDGICEKEFKNDFDTIKNNGFFMYKYL